MTLLQQLVSECRRLTDAMAYHESIGMYYWPEVVVANFQPEGPSECGICTNGARLIASKFNGLIAGYPISQHESALLIGKDICGHDFAVVGDYIVDWWAWDYDNSIPSPVILRGCDLAQVKYKPESEWTCCTAEELTKGMQTYERYRLPESYQSPHNRCALAA